MIGVPVVKYFVNRDVVAVASIGGVREGKREITNLAVESLGKRGKREQPATQAKDQVGDGTVDTNMASCTGCFATNVALPQGGEGQPRY